MYVDVRLDRDIEAGAKAKPRYSTDIITTDGGYEVRNSRWAYPLFSYEFNLEPGSPTFDLDLEDFVNLFHVVGGSAGTFRFRHWSDYVATNQAIGIGDGVKVAFQLYRTYTRGALTRNRKIVRPTIATVVARVGATVTAVTTDPLTGIITFASPPAAAAVITADFQFDNLVRFDSDELEMVGLMLDLDQPQSIVLKEVRG